MKQPETVCLSAAGVLAAVLLTCGGCVSPRPAGSINAYHTPYTPYRDLQVHAFSRPERDNAATIPASVIFRNRGQTALHIAATLDADSKAGVMPQIFETEVLPGGTAVWSWRFTPSESMERAVISGSIHINGRRDRDLFIAIQGPDPEGYKERGSETIEERGRVVAAYAPRNHDAIRREARQHAAMQPPPTLTIAANTRSDYAIVVNALPQPQGNNPVQWWRTQARLSASQLDLVDAVKDLQRIVFLQSGAKLVVTNHVTANQPAVRIQTTDALESSEGLYDAYRLRTVGRDIIIESESLDGLRHGIYGLLTDYLGCRWFQPRKLGEEIPIPDDRTVRIPQIDQTCGSVWSSVNGVSWGNSPLWDRRNRAVVNRGRMTFGHAWHAYINEREYPADRFPEYYARDHEGNILRRKGSRTPPNFCSSHPDVIEIVAGKINAMFDANPERIVASLDPNDYAPMCLCESCLAIDAKFGRTRRDGREVADRLLHFSNEIFERLKPEHRNKYLGILAYGHQMEPPIGAKAHERHATIICNFPRLYDHSRPWNDPTSPPNRTFLELLQGWLSNVNHLGLYDYYGHWFYFGPYAIIHKMREDLAAFHELGGASLMHEAQPNFAAQGLNLYIAAQLSWNINADVDVLLDEFFKRYYGPAAEAMRAYHLTAERYYALERPGNYTESRVAMRPEFWRDLDKCLSEAERFVSRLPASRQRYADRVKLARMGFDYGRVRFEYDVRYGSIATRFLEISIDHAAAIDYLDQHRQTIERLQDHHRSNDEYWPPLVPEYFRMDIGALKQKHREKL